MTIAARVAFLSSILDRAANAGSSASKIAASSPTAIVKCFEESDEVALRTVTQELPPALMKINEPMWKGLLCLKTRCEAMLLSNDRP
jgi:hypothetical protein